VKIVLSQKGKSLNWGSFRTGCWGDYLDPSEGKRWRLEKTA